MRLNRGPIFDARRMQRLLTQQRNGITQRVIALVQCHEMPQRWRGRLERHIPAAGWCQLGRSHGGAKGGNDDLSSFLHPLMDDIVDLVQEHHEQSAHVDESLGRYTAYTVRLKTLVSSVSRYIAYSSDVGEAFRPLARPFVVTAAYGISWAYIFTDVGYTCWQAAQDREHDSPLAADLAWIAARRGTFQTLASIVLPAFTIHSVVKHSARLFSKFKSPRMRVAGPTAAGLLTVPLLPFLFDHPVETVVERLFDAVEYRIAALRGDPLAKEMLDKGSLLRGYYVPTADNPKELGVSPTLAAQLAILGVGVDLVHMPRMLQLVSRHAQRLQRMPHKPLGSLATLRPLNEEKEQHAWLETSAQHFARRTLAKAEMDAFLGMHCHTHDERMRFLATRYASYKLTT